MTSRVFTAAERRAVLDGIDVLLSDLDGAVPQTDRINDAGVTRTSLYVSHVAVVVRLIVEAPEQLRAGWGVGRNAVPDAPAQAPHADRTGFDPRGGAGRGVERGHPEWHLRIARIARMARDVVERMPDAVPTDPVPPTAATTALAVGLAPGADRAIIRCPTPWSHGILLPSHAPRNVPVPHELEAMAASPPEVWISPQATRPTVELAAASRHVVLPSATERLRLLSRQTPEFLAAVEAAARNAQG